MKDFKEMAPASLMKKIEEKWGVKYERPKDSDGTKYGSKNDDDRVMMIGIGIITPRELKRLESAGIYVYQERAWRVPRSMAMVNGKTCYPVSRRYLEYQNKGRSKESRENERIAQDSLVSYAERVSGGMEV